MVAGLPLLAQGLVLAAGFWLAGRGPQALRRHLPFFLVLVVLAFYTLITPIGNLCFNQIVYYHINILPWFGQAIWLYVLGTGSFVGTYLGITNIGSPLKNTISARRYIPFHLHIKLTWQIWFIFALCLGGLLLSFVLDGHNPLQMLNPANRAKNQRLWLEDAHWPWLESLSDSLAAMPTLALGAGLLPLQVAAMVLLALPWLVLSGQRYRFLILLGGLLFFALRRHGLNRAWLRRWWPALLVGLLAFQFYNVNRWAIGLRKFDQISLDLVTPLPRIVMSETDNARLFMACLRYKELHSVGPDYGRSMFGFIAVRLTPARFFPNQEKPLAPNLQLQSKAIIEKEGAYGHPAISFYDELYLSFGWPGMVLGMTALALLLTCLPAPGASAWGDAVTGLAMVFTYQLLTRGYFPQQVELAAYMALPAGLLWLFSRLAQRGRRQAPTQSTVP